MSSERQGVIICPSGQLGGPSKTQIPSATLGAGSSTPPPPDPQRKRPAEGSRPDASLIGTASVLYGSSSELSSRARFSGRGICFTGDRRKSRFLAPKRRALVMTTRKVPSWQAVLTSSHNPGVDCFSHCSASLTPALRRKLPRDTESLAAASRGGAVELSVGME